MTTSLTDLTKTFLKTNRINQKQMAESLGVSQAQISRFLAGTSVSPAFEAKVKDFIGKTGGTETRATPRRRGRPPKVKTEVVAVAKKEAVAAVVATSKEKPVKLDRKPKVSTKVTESENESSLRESLDRLTKSINILVNVISELGKGDKSSPLTDEITHFRSEKPVAEEKLNYIPLSKNRIKEIAIQNRARSLAGMRPLTTKVKECLNCKVRFETTGDCTCPSCRKIEGDTTTFNINTNSVARF